MSVVDSNASEFSGTLELKDTSYALPHSFDSGDHTSQCAWGHPDFCLLSPFYSESCTSLGDKLYGCLTYNKPRRKVSKCDHTHFINEGIEILGRFCEFPESS